MQWLNKVVKRNSLCERQTYINVELKIGIKQSKCFPQKAIWEKKCFAFEAVQYQLLLLCEKSKKNFTMLISKQLQKRLQVK